MPDRGRIAAILRRDLSVADIPDSTDSGVFNSHGFRRQFVSSLAAGGVHPKDAQTLARHSTVSSTPDRNTHTSRGRLTEALATLPDLTTTPAEVARALRYVRPNH